MAKANKTKYALLGVLKHHSGSGYDIKKFCDNSIGYFWNENFGHIYPVLKKLEEENLITKKVEENEGHPQKNIYSITEKGVDDLNSWLTLPVDNTPVRSELLLKIFFSSDIPKDAIIERIKGVKSHAESVLSQLKNVEKLLQSPEYKAKNNKKDLALWIITVKSGIYDAEAGVKWCNDTLEILNSLD